MKTCKDCIHYRVCDIEAIRAIENIGAELCYNFIDESKFIELPCSIGDPYFTIERFCTEGGYHEKKEKVHLSDREYCCEECDKELRIVEHEFYNNYTIFQKEQYIGEYIFLAREEAEKKLEEFK